MLIRASALTCAVALAATVVIAGPSGPSYSCPKTQTLVEKVAREHPEIVEINVHAQPKGVDHSFVLASNDRALVGEADDPEDLDAVREDRVVVEKSAEGWDVTLPLHAAGVKRPLGALGVVLSSGSAGDEAGARRAAEAIRSTFEEALPYAGGEWK